MRYSIIVEKKREKPALPNMATAVKQMKNISSLLASTYELTLNEIQTIYNTAEGRPFEMIHYAYAYGFHRANQVARERKI